MEALAIRPEEQSFMPVMSIEQARDRYQQIVRYVNDLLVEDKDYGQIPGTNTKAVLLKPGAEKLCTLFGLSKRLQLIERIEDWDGKEHAGEPFFNYIYRYALYRGDTLIAEADGSCNSRESKYRWRKKERACPGCGVEGSVIKGKAEYGGGWLCWTKKGGCGAKFNETDERITSQVMERIPNPDIADSVNTMQKIAQKRALIAATLLAVNASDFFSQDLDDFSNGEPEANGHAESTKSEKKTESKSKAKATKVSPEEAERGALMRAITDGANVLLKLNSRINLWSYANDKYGVVEGLADLTLDQLREVAEEVSGRIEAAKAEAQEVEA